MLGVCLTLIDEPSDKEKFTEMYDTYYIFMIKTAMSVLNNKALAEETVQDCLLKLAEIIRDVPEIPSKRAKAMIRSYIPIIPWRLFTTPKPHSSSKTEYLRLKKAARVSLILKCGIGRITAIHIITKAISLFSMQNGFPMTI